MPVRHLVFARLTLLAVSLAWLTSCAAPSVSREDALAALEAELPDLVRKGDATGLSIAVVRAGEPAWVRTYGVRNSESGEPVEPDTLFEAASLSKPIFAYAVHRLAERGGIDLDKPLADYLPYERLEHDDRYKRITARMVLSHSSGLPNWGGTPLELKLAPGERFSYSGEGFVYLQKVVETLTGATLDELATQEVFEPLGMDHSSYVWKEEFSNCMATGHDTFGEPREKKRSSEAGGNAAYSLLTTSGDYAKFVEALLEGRGLDSASRQAMLTPQIQVVDRKSGSEPFENVYWGLGIGIQTGKAGEAFFHWGDNPGYRAYVIGYPDRGTGLVYFTNSEDGLSVAEAIVDRFVPDTSDALHWLDYERYDAPERLVRRSLQRTFRDEGREAGVALYHRQRTEQPDLEWEPLMNSIGYALLRKDALDEAIAAFELNAEAHPESANVYGSLAEAYMTAGRDDEAITNYEKSLALAPENHNAIGRIRWIRDGIEARKNPVRMSTTTLQKFAGRYGRFLVELNEDSLFASGDMLNGRYRLIPFAEDTFSLEGRSVYRLRFVADESGQVIRVVAWNVYGNQYEAERDSPTP